MRLQEETLWNCRVRSIFEVKHILVPFVRVALGFICDIWQL